MEPVTLDRIAWNPSIDDIAKRLHVREGSPQEGELLDLVRAAKEIGRPKALGGIAYVEGRGDDFVVIDGIRFTSRVLAVNLAATNRVFPFLATCGVELEQWADSLEDILHRFWSEAIRENALRSALQALTDYVDETYRPGHTSRMNPGSLADWPLGEQTPLFELLGDPEAAVGVRLTESLLMVPSKSVSGIRFGKDGSFESCMLCPREACPNRRAPYDPGLFERQYRRTTP